MSGLRIRSKLIPRTQASQKQFDQTTHSSSYWGTATPVNQKDPYLFESHLHSSTQQNWSGALEKNSKIKNSGTTTSSLTVLKQTFRQINWTYSSPKSEGCHRHIQVYRSLHQTAPEAIQDHSGRTPPSKANIKKTNITRLEDVGTVESKFMMSSTPQQLIQQSEIVMKGTREVEKIIPVKLVYEEQDLPLKMKSEDIRLADIWDGLKLIKNSNEYASLVLLPNCLFACSIIRIESAFSLESCIDDSIIQPDFKIKRGVCTYLFCQPYEYTLDELINHGKININNLEIVCKHLQPAVKALCNMQFSFFETTGIEKTIFYIHGKFKLLPIFIKGKMQTKKSLEQAQRTIKRYLEYLINRRKS